MSVESIQARIKSLEVQLRVLKAQIAEGSEGRVSHFKDLYGLLDGETDSTDEELNAAEYAFDWDEARWNLD